MGKIFTVIIFAALIAGGVFYFVGNKSTKPVQENSTMKAASQPAATVEPTMQSQASDSGMMASHQVTLTSEGFSPKSITIKKGESVTWTNTSSGQMWVASNVHPVHSEYDGTTLSQHCASPSSASFDECAGVGAGQTYTFTFNKVGTWGYHNHMSPGDLGTVVVQ